jgi:probable addiction module antidote protein
MRNYRDFVTETMKDPIEAAEYLSSSLEEYSADGNLEAFLAAVRSVAEAQGGIAELARKAELNRQTLYRTLSTVGNPRIKTLRSILDSLGFRLTIEPVSSCDSRKRQLSRVAV